MIVCQGASAVPSLERALRNPDYRIRRQTVIALEKIGGAAADSALQHALDDENESVRYCALMALTKAALSNTTTRLVVERLTDPDWQVRKLAVTLLGKTGNRQHKSALIQMLKDPDPQVRESASQAVKMLYEKAAADQKAIDPDAVSWLYQGILLAVLAIIAVAAIITTFR
jgi:HEAT repeat protein